MATFPIVKGVRLRATKVNRCGLPIAGASNFMVTDGFVTAKIAAVMNDAKELEQVNAEGRVCVVDRTPPERKHYKVDIELCNVNTGLITMFNGWEQVLDYNDDAIGFRDQKTVDDDYGVALEIWTGGRSDDDCATQTTDSIFTAPGTGKKYGYLLIGATEFTLGDISVSAAVSTLTLSGISIAMPQWGRGPWNVAALDANNTAGRLLEPLNEDSHYTFFRTPIEPPEPTVDQEPKALAISSIFTNPNYYFGGPASAPAANVAPNQPAASAAVAKTVAVLGVPTGGTFTLTYRGKTTATIVYNAAAAAVASALVALDDGYVAADFTVTGSAGGPYSVTLARGGGLTGTGSFTGGTNPALSIY
jgi:hypothetical protein